jgi:hypothetical protein
MAPLVHERDGREIDVEEREGRIDQRAGCSVLALRAHERAGQRCDRGELRIAFRRRLGLGLRRGGRRGPVCSTASPKQHQ